MIDYLPIEVRWADLDANAHLANSSYMKFTSHARITVLNKVGVSMRFLQKHKIGPAILQEDFSFFKEIYPNQTVYVSTEINGSSEDCSLFSFVHNIYDKDGNHLAQSSLFGVWMSLVERKITKLPDEMKTLLSNLIDWETVQILTKKDIYNLPNKPNAINPKEFLND